LNECTNSSTDQGGGKRDACFVATAEQKLAYVNFDDSRSAAKPLTRDEARRIAANIAKLRDYGASPERAAPPVKIPKGRQ
jgi:hypothetical protein